MTKQNENSFSSFLEDRKKKFFTATKNQKIENSNDSEIHLNYFNNNTYHPSSSHMDFKKYKKI